MQTQSQPTNWLVTAASSLQWPVIVFAAFWLGRSMTKLESRVLKAEKNVQDLIERHMPHIHKALGDIRETLATIQGMLTR